MGYTVETSGRLLLPQHLEAQALTVLEVELAAQPGPFDDTTHVDDLAELAGFAGAGVRREGEWLVLTTDEEGDPKWSEQATGFYAGLARWVRQGEVHLVGEDDARWSYRYGPDGVIQVGQNGWDGSIEPFGAPVEQAPAPTPETPRGRAVLMTLVFVGGLVLIIGVAMLAAGL